MIFLIQNFKEYASEVCFLIPFSPKPVPTKHEYCLTLFKFVNSHVSPNFMQLLMMSFVKTSCWP